MGVETGRFAAPMGIQIGIDPAYNVHGYAARRGIATVQAVAEALPFADKRFQRVLCVTTLCFVDDASAMLRETYRVLQPGGVLVIGFIDRTSHLGQHYLAHQAENVFYRDASFFSAAEVKQLLAVNGFIEPRWVQTLSTMPEQSSEIEALLSLSAGALVYVGATQLLPQAEKEHRKDSLFALAAGILVAVLIVLSK
ncbi:MAG: class I SAM-dependent methyltransferase [Halopseudomonas sp.]